MKSTLVALFVVLTFPHAGFAQSQPETRPVAPGEQEDMDSSERLLARLEKAARRYLDLANASTDPKATAEYLRLYEEKEKAILDLRKETAAERKCQDALRAIRGWVEVATEAASRASQSLYDARMALEADVPKTIDLLVRHAQEEEANATKAREEAVQLIVGTMVCTMHRAQASLLLNRLEEQRRTIALELEKARQILKK